MSATIAFLLSIPFAFFLLRFRKLPRVRHVPPHTEHVLILGASAGVGRVLAVQYARRGAHVCVVGRNREALIEVQDECDAVSGSETTIAVEVDFSNADDMVALRDRIEREWGRLDTLAVIAGVSALKPLLATAGIEHVQGEPLADAEVDGVKESVRIANAAMQGNFIGPLTSAISFISLLTRTSPSPAILLLSSVASVIPAPTRALYAASKGASLLLYQSLAIEHPNVAFSFILPGTIEGDFRKSAVDGGPAREADPNKHGLRREEVAQRCISAVDKGERTIFMGETYRLGHLLYWLWPSFIEAQARKKYNYNV